MREILFKAKSKDADIWAEGDLVRDIDNFGEHRTCIHQILGKGRWQTIFVDPETVCQYTGLTDKNGRKIFEGDIVKTKYYGKDTENGCNFNDYDTFAIDYGEASFRLDNKERRYFLTKLKDIEVIGNIFDNPELLESEA